MLVEIFFLILLTHRILSLQLCEESKKYISTLNTTGSHRRSQGLGWSLEQGFDHPVPIHWVITSCAQEKLDATCWVVGSFTFAHAFTF